MGFKIFFNQRSFNRDTPFANVCNGMASTPRGTHLGVREQVLHRINTQQLMQQSAVTHIDFGRFHLAFFQVGVLGLKLTNHKSVREQI
jgi:hypothetical protein